MNHRANSGPRIIDYTFSIKFRMREGKEKGVLSSILRGKKNNHHHKSDSKIVPDVSDFKYESDKINHVMIIVQHGFSRILLSREHMAISINNDKFYIKKKLSLARILSYIIT